MRVQQLQAERMCDAVKAAGVLDFISNLQSPDLHVLKMKFMPFFLDKIPETDLIMS